MIRDLPLGGKMWLATTHSRLIDGSEYVNVGITPDVIVPKTVKEISEGTDIVLIKALDILRNE